MKATEGYRSTLVFLGLGLVAGTMGGLLGIGGGVLIVPGLVFLAGLDQHKAHGTSLVATLLLAAAGIARYSADGNIDWVLAAGVAVGGVCGAVFGARAANAVKGPTLKRIFAVFLVVVSARMVLYGLTGNSSHAALHHVFSADTAACWGIVLGIGLVTGFVSGLLGIGGGVVMVPAMVLLVGVSQKVAQGASLAAMIPTALSGIVAYRKAENVDLSVGKWVGLGTAAGAIVGATAVSHLADNTLQFIFAGFLVSMAALMITKK